MNLLEFLKEYRVPHRESGTKHSTSGWVNVDCPECGPGSQSWHLGLRVEGGGANCWRCGPKRTGEVLAALTGLAVPEVLSLTASSWQGGRTPAPKRDCGKLLIPAGVGPLRKRHREYLRGRGFDPAELSALWGVQGVGASGGRLAWRVFIPVRSGDETVSWTTRSTAEGGTRYLSAKPSEEKASSRSVLYGAELARSSVVVVEGPTDAWAVGPGAVATLGVGYSKAQLRLVGERPVRVVCFDSQPEAQRRASQLCDDLMCLPGVTYNVELTAKDAATSTAKEIRQVRRLAGLL